MINPIRQFLCDHDFELFKTTYYGIIIDWFRCEKCRKIIQGGAVKNAK